MSQRPTEDMRSPLHWPVGEPRTAPHKRSRAGFGSTTIAKQTKNLAAELSRLGVREGWILSSNLALRLDGMPRSQQRAIYDDPGIAVYFMLDGEPHNITCDGWDLAEHNIRAIVKTIEADRGKVRWRAANTRQAFAGYRGLPNPDAVRPWWEVLGTDKYALPHEIRLTWQRLVKEYHPDSPGGGDATKMVEVNIAWANAKGLGKVS